jgi:hypothetical protein
MTKKDRIALAISAVYMVFPLVMLFEKGPGPCLVFSLPVLIYWAVRFGKGDISFLKINEGDR